MSAALVLLVAGTSGCSAGGKSPKNVAVYHPVIDPAQFSTTIDNPWLPMKPGDARELTGSSDGKPAREVRRVTAATKVIAGVTTRVVSDELYVDGRLDETTRDYFAQDRSGNVWYFGEDTAELDARGNVRTTEGTWHAGRDGAQPGIVAEAEPHVGRTLRQEYYVGHAEDMYKVVAVHESVTVPFGSYSDALRTEEWTPLEPDSRWNLYYAPGVGVVREVAVKGEPEDLVLRSFTRSG